MTAVYYGCRRCPACGAVASNQPAIDQHILRKRDDQHLKLHDIARKSLKKG
jgi:hypothetical protein